MTKLSTLAERKDKLTRTERKDHAQQPAASGPGLDR
jgi:hypothetical protein